MPTFYSDMKLFKFLTKTFEAENWKDHYSNRQSVIILVCQVAF